MKSLLLFCFIACVYANLPSVLALGWVDYGPYDGLYKLGEVAKKYGSPNDDDLRASKRGTRFLHEVKRFFKTGFYTLPPLDPYYKANLPPLVIANEKYLHLVAKLSHFNVTGLVGYQNDLLDIRRNNGRVDYRFNVPRLSVQTLADVEMVVGGLIPFRVKGMLSVLLSDVVVRGALQVRQVSRNGKRLYQLQGQHTRLHVEDVQAKFDNLLKQPALQLRGQGSARSEWDDNVKIILDYLNGYLAHLIFNQANEILDGPTVDQINAYLLGPEPV